MPDSPSKDNRLEALKMYADWSKWLAAIDTAAIGALSTYLLARDSCHLNQGSAIAACFAAVFFLLSLWGACQFLFSMPGVVMSLDTNQGKTTHELRNPSFRFSLGRYHQVQYVPLYFAVVSLVGLLYLSGATRIG